MTLQFVAKATSVGMYAKSFGPCCAIPVIKQLQPQNRSERYSYTAGKHYLQRRNVAAFPSSRLTRVLCRFSQPRLAVVDLCIHYVLLKH